MAAITAVNDLTKSTKFTLFTLTIWKPSIAEKIFKLKLLKKKSIFFFVNSQCGRTMRKRHRNCECTSISAWFIDTYGWMYANAKAKQLLPWPLMSCAELTCLTGDSHKSDILQIRLLPTCNKKIKLQIAPNWLTTNKIPKVWPGRHAGRHFHFGRRHVHLLRGTVQKWQILWTSVPLNNFFSLPGIFPSLVSTE